MFFIGEFTVALFDYSSMKSTMAYQSRIPVRIAGAKVSAVSATNGVSKYSITGLAKSKIPRPVKRKTQMHHRAQPTKKPRSLHTIKNRSCSTTRRTCMPYAQPRTFIPHSHTVSSRRKPQKFHVASRAGNKARPCYTAHFSPYQVRLGDSAYTGSYVNGEWYYDLVGCTATQVSVMAPAELPEDIFLDVSMSLFQAQPIHV